MLKKPRPDHAPTEKKVSHIRADHLLRALANMNEVFNHLHHASPDIIFEGWQAPLLEVFANIADNIVLLKNQEERGVKDDEVDM